MIKKLRSFADDHSLAFWVISITTIVLVIYKPVTVFATAASYETWDEAFLRLSLTLTVILMMKELYTTDYKFYFTPKNLGKGLLWCWPTLILMALSLLTSVSDFSRPVVMYSLCMLLFEYFGVGFFEEVVCRGFLMQHMLRHYKNDSNAIIKATLLSSVLFGVMHLGNLVNGNPIGTITQVIYSTMLAIFFCGVYLRTKNLLPIALVHGLIDFVSGISGIFYTPAEYAVMKAGQAANTGDLLSALVSAALLTLICVPAFIVGLYLIRKKKQPEIMELWDLEGRRAGL